MTLYTIVNSQEIQYHFYNIFIIVMKTIDFCCNNLISYHHLKRKKTIKFKLSFDKWLGDINQITVFKKIQGYFFIYWKYNL
jgi:hypothetical protein